jgi:SlyX protein
MEESARPDARFTDLETKLAYQERTIAELGALVFEQGKRIERMESALRKTSARLRELSEGKQPGLPENERPPHY